MSIEHIFDALAGCDVMQSTIVELRPQPQMKEIRSSTRFVVVERLDPHCADDLVSNGIAS